MKRERPGLPAEGVESPTFCKGSLGNPLVRHRQFAECPVSCQPDRFFLDFPVLVYSDPRFEVSFDFQGQKAGQCHPRDAACLRSGIQDNVWKKKSKGCKPLLRLSLRTYFLLATATGLRKPGPFGPSMLAKEGICEIGLATPFWAAQVSLNVVNQNLSAGCLMSTKGAYSICGECLHLRMDTSPVFASIIGTVGTSTWHDDVP